MGKRWTIQSPISLGFPRNKITDLASFVCKVEVKVWAIARVRGLSTFWHCHFFISEASYPRYHQPIKPAPFTGEFLTKNFACHPIRFVTIRIVSNFTFFIQGSFNNFLNHLRELFYTFFGEFFELVNHCIEIFLMRILYLDPNWSFSLWRHLLAWIVLFPV